MLIIIKDPGGDNQSFQMNYSNSSIFFYKEHLEKYFPNFKYSNTYDEFYKYMKRISAWFFEFPNNHFERYYIINLSFTDYEILNMVKVNEDLLCEARLLIREINFKKIFE